jgi:hypothetical protein
MMVYRDVWLQGNDLAWHGSAWQYFVFQGSSRRKQANEA